MRGYNDSVVRICEAVRAALPFNHILLLDLVTLTLDESINSETSLCVLVSSFLLLFS